MTLGTCSPSPEHPDLLLERELRTLWAFSKGSDRQISKGYLLYSLSGCCNPDSLLNLWIACTLLLQPGKIPQTLQPLQTHPQPRRWEPGQPHGHTHVSVSAGHISTLRQASLSHTGWSESSCRGSLLPGASTPHLAPVGNKKFGFLLMVIVCHTCHHLQGLDQEHSQHLSVSVHSPPKICEF